MTVDKKIPKQALIIKAEKNRDWREESRKRRRKNLLPAEVQAQRNGKYEGLKGAQVERDEVSKTSGIQFVKQNEQDVIMSEGNIAQEAPEKPAPPPKTADEEALESFLGNGEKKSTLTIPALESDLSNDYKLGSNSNLEYQNESDRFKADLLSRPDVATLSDYAAVPVEDFGAAMLRGMGWTEGGKVGKQRAGATIAAPKEKPRVVERRPALLGIGAKEVPGGVGDEFGAWGKVARGKRKTELSYTPVVMKNSVTGELLSEEELKARTEEKEKEKKTGEDDWKERRDRNLRVDADRKGERRDRDRNRNRDREKLMIEDERNGYGNKDHTRSKEGNYRDRSRSKERRHRDRDRSKERRKRDRSREDGESRHNSSRRHSRSSDQNSKHGSSRRERSRSAEWRHRRY